MSIASAQEAPAAAQPAQSEVPLPSGLPQRAPEPRTMHDKWPVFAAFVLTWIAIVGYALTVGTSLGRIARRVERFERQHAGS